MRTPNQEAIMRADIKPWDWAIQCLEVAFHEEHARRLVSYFEKQDGYLSSRVLPPAPSRPDWQVQVFMETNGEGPTHGWLPDGCRHVVLPPALFVAA